MTMGGGTAARRMTMPMRDRTGDGVTTGEYTDIIDVCRDWSAALCGRLATVGNDRRARVVTGVCEPGVSLCDAAAVARRRSAAEV